MKIRSHAAPCVTAQIAVENDWVRSESVSNQCDSIIKRVMSDSNVINLTNSKKSLSERVKAGTKKEANKLSL